MRMYTSSIWILLILLSSFGIANAQDRPFILDLENDQPKLIGKFKCSQVIDKRIIKNNVGFAKRGLNNRMVEVKMNGDLEQVIKTTVNNMTLKPIRKNDIIFVIHDFYVSERTTAMSEKGRFQMEVEFLRQKDSLYYSLGTDFIEVEKGGLDVTKKLKNRVLEGLTQLITNLNQSGWLDEPGTLTTLDEAITTYDYSTIPAPGMYGSFNQLGKSNPMESFGVEFRRIENKNKVEQYNFRAIDKKNRKKRVLYISNGKTIFMSATRYSYGRYFIKAKHHGRYIYFEDRFADGKSVNTGIIVGGAVGGMITMGISKLKGLVLDTKTGNVYELTNQEMQFILESYPELMEKYRNSKKKLKDKEAAILAVNALEM